MIIYYFLLLYISAYVIKSFDNVCIQYKIIIYSWGKSEGDKVKKKFTFNFIMDFW